MSERPYLASTLSSDEWIVLDALACAQSEGETPLSPQELWAKYRITWDVGAPIDVHAVLWELRTKLLAARDFDGRWFPTRLGRDTVQFAESTRIKP